MSELIETLWRQFGVEAGEHFDAEEALGLIQRERINKQEKNGDLTKAQGNQLKANDRAIKKQEHADVKANGGTLTKGEQKQFNQEENANSKMIHDEAHPAGQ